jgi:hypothetical protein
MIKTYKIADISTCHITKTDAELMHPTAPFHLAEVNGGHGSIFYLTDPAWDMADRLARAGFSSEFVECMCEARTAGCDYIRFDADGEKYPGMRTFNW